MARSPALSPEEARRKAEDRFKRGKQRESDAQTAHEERAKLQRAEDDKTQRLRALRLAKEAADAEAAQRAAAEKAAAATVARDRKTARMKALKGKTELV
jgi:hypothetical protein